MHHQDAVNMGHPPVQSPSMAVWLALLPTPRAADRLGSALTSTLGSLCLFSPKLSPVSLGSLMAAEGEGEKVLCTARRGLGELCAPGADSSEEGEGPPLEWG